MVGFPQHELPVTRLIVKTSHKLRSNDVVIRPSIDTGHRSLPVGINVKLGTDTGCSSPALLVRRCKFLLLWRYDDRTPNRQLGGQARCRVIPIASQDARV